MPASPTAAAHMWGPTDWQTFDTALESAFDRYRMVGGAIAVVSADAVLHTTTLGVRTLKGRKRVTSGTTFRIASVTKSMTAALVATSVDDGTLGWDQPVVDAWSGFRAPTDEMTRSLRVRDLLGMSSGLGDYLPVVTSVHFGEPTAAQLLQSVVNLPVLSSTVDEQFFYNNTLVAVGGYLPLLATGAAPDDLEAGFAEALQRRILTPAGMTGARVLDDPNGVYDDYADGHGLDLRARAVTVPFAPAGVFAPAGGVMATVTEMAAWVRLQLRRGQSVTGQRVVQEASLTECWLPHVSLLGEGALDPASTALGYGMGFNSYFWPDGTHMIYHAGEFNGFVAYLAFLPDHDVGFVVLNSISGASEPMWEQLKLEIVHRLGIGGSASQPAPADGTEALTALTALGRQVRPVDRTVIEPWLGNYQGGWSIVREGREVALHLGPRVWPMGVKSDGDYVVTEGPAVTLPVHLGREFDGTPNIELVGIETVRRTTG